jgi:hypothetical protein
MKDKFAGPMAVLMLLTTGVLAISQWTCKSRMTSSESREEPVSTRPDSEIELGRSEGIVRLSDGQMKEFGIEAGPATSGRLRIEIVLPGEVVLNADRVAHVVPRVSGVVREVRKNLGDSVRRSEDRKSVV